MPDADGMGRHSEGHVCEIPERNHGEADEPLDVPAPVDLSCARKEQTEHHRNPAMPDGVVDGFLDPENAPFGAPRAVRTRGLDVRECESA